MRERPLRRESEILHGKRIRENAEDIWGWGSPAGMIRANRRAQLYLELTNMNSGHEVLEIGCGTGLFTEKVARSGARITATDLSEDLLDFARKRNIPNCKIERADVHSLNFSDSHFNVVYGSSILHHLDIEIAFKEICRVLKSNGQIVFTEPNMLNPQIFLERHISWLRILTNNTPDETAFYRHLINKELALHGFRDIKVIPYDFLHPCVPAILTGIVEKIGFLIEKVPLVREIAGSLIIYGKKQY